MYQMNHSEILRNAREDPELLSQIDIPTLMMSLDTMNPYFENKTLADISTDIFEAVSSELAEFSMEQKKNICNRLTEYYYVGHVYQFQKGRYIRWIRKPKEGKEDKGGKEGGAVKLTNGGVVMEILFRESGGTYILCMTNQRRPCQLRFDDCIFFQKLTDEEQLVLAITAYCDTDRQPPKYTGK
jgi:hypothetical protein